MKTFPDLASAQAYTATLPVGTFAVSQNLDGSTQVVEGLTASNNVPQAITAFQFKAALVNAGAYDKFSSSMTGASQISSIVWNEATSFSRNDPYVLAAATSAGMTSTQLDAIFSAGSLLQP